MTIFKFITLTAGFIFFLENSFSQEKGYYRFPSLHNDIIVFTAEGDLWKYNNTTGLCLRLTTNHGVESNAAISPDGKWIAFNAEYEGPSEAYVIPVEGGIPKRVTWEGLKGGSAPSVYGWTTDGKVIVSTSYFSMLPAKQVILIDPATLASKLIPLAQAAEGVFDEKENLYFTRLTFQGSQTKRYKGGTAQNLWRFNGSSEAVPLTGDYTGTSKNPMLFDGRLYFLSDRDGTMNLWSMIPDGTGLKQHTFSSAWDLRDAELHNGFVIYQKQADLYIYNISDNTETVLDISIVSDFDQRRQYWEKEPMKKLQHYAISDSGNNILLTARGRVFSSPADGGRWIELTRKTGIRYKSAMFKGKSEEVLFLSDESGEVEIWKTSKDGFKSPEQVTFGSKVLIMDYLPSPDGKYIAYTEKDYALRLCDVAKKTTKQIDLDDINGFSGLCWSPDSKWLAYVDPAGNQVSQIKIFNIETNKSFYLTTDRVESYNPVFSTDGKWIFFISDRTFKNIVGSPWGPRQPEPYYDKTGRIYMVSLYDSIRSPFLSFDELNPKVTMPAKETMTVKESGKRKKKAENLENQPDFENVFSRYYEVPVPAGNISSLQVTKKYLYWLQIEINDPQNQRLFAIEISNSKNNKPVEVSDKVTGFQLSGNGQKLLIRTGEGIFMTDANGKKADLKDAAVNLKDWAFQIDPVEDWEEMLIDAWRLERDYFYDKNMHGVDWKGVLDRHLPLVTRLTDRYELDDLLASMVSELSALHTFVYGGEKRVSPDDIAISSLGARLEKNELEGGYKIKEIFNGDPDFPELRSPLSQPHNRIESGDIITKINGVNVLTVPHINTLLIKKDGQEVRLTLKDRSAMEYEQIVKPVSMDEDINLRYSEWEYTRRIEVEEKSDNQIGYFHLRAMGGNNFQEFVKGYYPVFDREGLIIDVRNNRGGNIDSWVINRLLRKAWFYWQSRAGKPYWNMQYAFRGHIVVLCNEYTASDGEAFAEGVKRLDLGEIIGTRTWGGEIWLSSSNRLVDNGIATAAEFGVYSPDGEWLIEGHGVDPDIVVDNLPFVTFNGKDAQLDAAIEFLKKKIKEEPVDVPVIPGIPDKSFQYKK